MIEVTDTTQITLDDTTVDVADLPDDVKQLVQYLDEWREKEVNLSADLLMVRSALAHIQTVLATQINAWLAAKAASAAPAEDSPAE